jgi:hypothetical protein
MLLVLTEGVWKLPAFSPDAQGHDVCLMPTKSRGILYFALKNGRISHSARNPVNQA